MLSHLFPRGITGPRTNGVISSGLLAVALIISMMMAQAAFADSINLVRNSDFERCFTGDGTADGWVASRTAQGGVNARMPTEGIPGGVACHQLTVPDAAPIDFYMCASVVRGLSPGDRGVVSVWVRAIDVRDGHGAYAGLAYYDAAGKRISFTDTSESLRGSTSWQRLSQAFVIPPGTVRVEMNLVLHGHGTAYFDEAQVEKGENITDWSAREPLYPDWIYAEASSKPAVAIFKDDIPPSGTASDPAYLFKMAKSAGYRAEFLNSAELADPSRLSRSRYGILIMPYGGAFPADAASGIKGFLEDGGGLLNVGGYPFDKPLVRAGGKWINPDDVEPNPADLQLLVDPLTMGAGWTTGGRDIKDQQARVITDSGRKCIAFGTKSMPSGGWVTLGVPPVSGLPPDMRTLAFRARSLQPDVMLSMEVVERDGSRWRRIVALSTKWHTYQVDLASLEYWHDNPSVGRGG
ncbi:MAG: carbohydrate binding domain-containing protein, partial [Armatimonadota bacterium]